MMILRLIRKFSSSALYITGDKAQKHFAVLTPIIDFDVKNKEVLVKNLKSRNLKVDLNQIEDHCNFFKDLETRKNLLEQTRQEIIAKLHDKQDDQKLKMHLQIVKEDLKNVRNMCYIVEEGAAMQILNLPNNLHEKTPENFEQEIYRHGEINNRKSPSHLEIASKKNYVKYINSWSCYLMSSAALFEHALKNYFNDQLINANFLQFSNSDFVKSIIVEGCYGFGDYLTLQDIHCFKADSLNKLHLVGASSLYSFMAYFTKHSMQRFPFKAFCIGRKYQEVKNVNNKSLFHLNQTSEICIFMANNTKESLEDILNNIIDFYKPLNVHFTISLIPACELQNAESLKISIKMFSNYLEKYVEVGYLSFYDEYISKRLLFNYNVDKIRKYPKVIGGSLINIHKFLGCVLENNCLSNKSLLNSFLSKYL